MSSITYLQIDPSFLLNFVVIDGKVTHFCPNLTTFVPTIRNIYEDMIEIGLKQTSELTVSEGISEQAQRVGDKIKAAMEAKKQVDK